jgi:putative pyruvate formate lyase activating enzyme
MPGISDIPELSRKVSDDEYLRVVRFAELIGIENGYIQEGNTADESFIPAFDFEGL